MSFTIAHSCDDEAEIRSYDELDAFDLEFMECNIKQITSLIAPVYIYTRCKVQSVLQSNISWHFVIGFPVWLYRHEYLLKVEEKSEQ